MRLCRMAYSSTNGLAREHAVCDEKMPPWGCCRRFDSGGGWHGVEGRTSLKPGGGGDAVRVGWNLDPSVWCSSNGAVLPVIRPATSDSAAVRLGQEMRRTMTDALRCDALRCVANQFAVDKSVQRTSINFPQRS